jgi:hypothetical protein
VLAALVWKLPLVLVVRVLGALLCLDELER